MLRIILSILVFAAIGFAISYFIFAQVGDGNYLSLDTLFFDKATWKDLAMKFGGIDVEAIRNKILISTGVGALIGAIVGTSTRKK